LKNLPKYIDEVFNLNTHPSIEAMVVDRADEIAYISHDIDDGINSHLIGFEDLKEINHLVYSLIDYSRDKIDNSRVLCASVDAKDELPIGFDKELELQIKKLKKILFIKMYKSKQIARKMYAGKQAVKGLYKALMDDTNMLPQFYRELLHARNKHRVTINCVKDFDRSTFDDSSEDA